ncbi:hypothetical protein B566_EDAN009987 [Ephemera danica]|nr:hypothetical protein B566_EDAN009987 [Ephemera danica]
MIFNKMFGNLFEDGVLPAGPNTSPVRTNNCVSSVSEPRGSTKLCGLENLGATCYLNSLIQTLLFTPEFREGLMALDLEPLEGTTTDNVRKIPLQLQKLFAQLLLYDVASISTNALTESFGWTDHEVECLNCNFVSERQEGYMDLTVAVGQNKTLKSSLYDAYCEIEPMTGSNQYLCPTCQTHTDANRVVKIRQLPPILTLSLLRFLYDPVKQQRFKDESRLEFPSELDMAAFCEESLPSEITTYELLSVIVHRGGAHGGHYHAIIRDIDQLGHWDLASRVTILIGDILRCTQDQTLTLEQLLDKVLERTGVPWSKSYKASCGTIAQFLNSHCSYFFVEGSNDLSATVTMICDPVEPKKEENGECEPEPCPSQPQGRQWFNFNDAEVTPVHEEDIENFFEGEESAYMLVYRRKSLKRPEEAQANSSYGVPVGCMASMEQLNAQAEADREQSHLIWVRILPRSSYTICQRTLFPSDTKILEIELTIDERETLATLRKRAKELCAHHLSNTEDWHELNSVQQTNYNLIDLDSYDANNIDYAWEEQVECQPLQHCAVVFDNVENLRNPSDWFDITIKNLEDGTVHDIQTSAEHYLRNRHIGLRLGEDMHNLDPPLYDYKSLADAGIKPDCTVYADPSISGPILLNQLELGMFTVEEAWHVACTNQQGDVTKVLNNPHASIVQEKLNHGTHLLLRRGFVQLKGMARLKLLVKEPPANENQIACPAKPPHMSFFKNLDVDSTTMTLRELKAQIAMMINDARQQHFEEDNLRIRILSKATIWCHEPGGMQYRGPRDLVWDQKKGPLAPAVAKLTGVEESNLVIARYHLKSQKSILLNIHDDERMMVDGDEKENVQLLQPHSLNDGDILLVKDASVEKDNLKDFTTTAQLETWLNEQEEQDEQRRSNEEAAAAALEWTSGQAQTRLPERGIHIHVSDFC